jgi:Tol biopolymer transport system component
VARPRRLIGLLALAACTLAPVVPAGAAWPGTNGRLIFNTTENDEYRLVTTDLHGRHKRVLARFPPLPSGLQRTSGLGQWSPSGTRVLYQRIATGIVTVAPDGSRRRTLRTGLLWPSWAPSGREIVAVAEDGNVSPAALVRLRPDGSRLLRIPTPPSETGLALPRWSPSGRWILYEQGAAGVRYVWRVRPDGTGARQLVAGWSFTWAPDGRRFAYADGRAIWSMRPDGSGRRLLSRGLDNTTIVSLAWSPNGRRIALVRQFPADEHDTSTVATIRARGGGERRLFGGERYINAIDWQPR